MRQVAVLRSVLIWWITVAQQDALVVLMQTAASKLESTGCRHLGVIAVTPLITILDVAPDKTAVIQKIIAVQTGVQQALMQTAASKQESTDCRHLGVIVAVTLITIILDVIPDKTAVVLQ